MCAHYPPGPVACCGERDPWESPRAGSSPPPGALVIRSCLRALCRSSCCALLRLSLVLSGCEPGTPLRVVRVTQLSGCVVYIFVSLEGFRCLRGSRSYYTFVLTVLTQGKGVLLLYAPSSGYIVTQGCSLRCRLRPWMSNRDLNLCKFCREGPIVLVHFSTAEAWQKWAWPEGVRGPPLSPRCKQPRVPSRHPFPDPTWAKHLFPPPFFVLTFKKKNVFAD